MMLCLMAFEGTKDQIWRHYTVESSNVNAFLLQFNVQSLMHIIFNHSKAIRDIRLVSNAEKSILAAKRRKWRRHFFLGTMCVAFRRKFLVLRLPLEKMCNILFRPACSISGINFMRFLIY